VARSVGDATTRDPARAAVRCRHARGHRTDQFHLGHGRAPRPVPDCDGNDHARSSDRRACRFRRDLLDAGGRAARDRSRPIERPRSLHRGGPRRIAAPARRRHRPRPARTRRRGLRHAWPFQPPRPATSNGASGICSRASTATPSAGCGARSSRWNRAISCASCSNGSMSRRTRRSTAPMRSPACWPSSKASRHRPRLGKANCCRRASTTIRFHGSTISVSPAASAGPACIPPAARRTAGKKPARPGRSARLRSPCCRAATVRRGERSVPRTTKTPSCCRRARAGCRTGCCNMARRSSTNCWPASACCAWNSRMHWPNWSRAASWCPTVSAACVPCWYLHPSATRRTDAAGDAWPCSGSRMRAAGR
jgi:hypothetical protein